MDAIPELARTLGPGRRAVPLEVSVVGEVGDSDLALLAGARGSVVPMVKRLRDRHHALAKALVQGFSDAEASAITGYDPSRIATLKNDPSFKQLLAEYRTVKDGCFADFQERASVVSLEYLNILMDHAEETPEAISPSQALEVVKVLADRTGHAPVAKSVSVNATVDLTDRLTRARNRVIEAQKNGTTGA